MTIATDMPLELLGTVSIYLGIGVQVMMALVLGGLVGYDREKKLKTAGIKTNILICLGSTLYTSIGILVATSAANGSDVNRIAAQIVSGIGFLGAGAIIQSQGSVIGLTTAATIWVVAAIGFAVGAGYPFSALFFTVTVLIVLNMIKPIYKFLENEKDFDYYQIEILSQGSVIKIAKSMIENDDFEIDEMYEEDHVGGKKGAKILNVFLLTHRRRLERLTIDLKQAIKVRDVVYHSVSQDIAKDHAKENERLKLLHKKKS